MQCSPKSHHQKLIETISIGAAMSVPTFAAIVASNPTRQIRGWTRTSLDPYFMVEAAEERCK
jgi:hypothetical protein